jgi:hypothetical protein
MDCKADVAKEVCQTKLATQSSQSFQHVAGRLQRPMWRQRSAQHAGAIFTIIYMTGECYDGLSQLRAMWMLSYLLSI